MKVFRWNAFGRGAYYKQCSYHLHHSKSNFIIQESNISFIAHCAKCFKWNEKEKSFHSCKAVISGVAAIKANFLFSRPLSGFWIGGEIIFYSTFTSKCDIYIRFTPFDDNLNLNPKSIQLSTSIWGDFVLPILIYCLRVFGKKSRKYISGTLHMNRSSPIYCFHFYWQPLSHITLIK